MSDFKNKALQLLQNKQFTDLDKLLGNAPGEHSKLADELSLLSLIDQGMNNEQLERPLDNYIAKYPGDVPLSNIVTAARLKFELGKLEEALDLLTAHDVPRENTDASEIAVLCLYNLKRHEPGKALIDHLLDLNPSNARYHEWNILFSYKVHKLTDVLSSWEAFVKLGGEFSQRIGVLGFVIRAFMGFGRLDEAQKVFFGDKNIRQIGKNITLFLGDCVLKENKSNVRRNRLD